MPTVRSFLKKFETPTQRMLRLSAEGKYEKVRDLLNEKGLALAGVRDSQGRTPLFLAALNGQRDTLPVLFAAGADPTTPNAAGQSPLQALLAIPEPTEGQRSAIRFLAGLARVEPIDPASIQNPEVRKELEEVYLRRTKVSPTAVNVVARAKNLPEDVERLIKGYGRRKTARKTKRRQTRRGR
jgi:hypothetical protein